MLRITHSVDPEKMQDLLERVPRACIVFVNAGMVDIVPVELRFQQRRYWIGISGGESGAAPGPNDRVKLLVDEGMYYFDMRGIWIGGRASFDDVFPEADSSALNWFQLVPDKYIAWDFASMRDVSGQ
jgi:hypothetical protein